MPNLFDAKEVMRQAEEEVREEFVEAAKKRIKVKMKAVKDAEIILANAKRELEYELEAIGDGN
jgi:hypothetical protein